MIKFLKNLFRKKPRVYVGWDCGSKDETVFMAAKFENGQLIIIDMVNNG